MHRSLIRHHTTPCDTISRIDVDAERSYDGELSVRFVAHGSIGDLLVPLKAKAERTDLLWHHTCFEAFIKPQPGAAYFELNASPSTRWALYSFSSFREGMAEAPSVIQVSPIVLKAGGETLELSAKVSGLPRSAGWRVALSAIIEEKNGRKSFWALKHLPEKPDFHHDDCFDLELSGSPRA